MIVNAGYRGKVGVKAPKFTYTGKYNIRKDGVVELLTNGTIVFLEPKVIDLFMVGGGGAGSARSGSSFNSRGYGGGGGGYTRTVRKINVTANSEIQVTVGAGGTADINSMVNGNSSAFGAFIVAGGYGGLVTTMAGGNGGSGGGSGVISNSDGGAGGNDGGNGETGYNNGGVGQGFTSREFGESTGKLYAGGGGGGRYMVSQTPVISAGGSGGGGSGGWAGNSNNLYQPAAAGIANTGGGGGGGAKWTDSNQALPGSGGSGIVCFRESVELPELAGTWVMNNRIYAPEDEIRENVSFTMPGLTVSVYDVKSIMVRSTTFSGIKFFGVATTINANSFTTVYDFNTNSWKNTQNSSPAVLTFPSGATASDTFREWLASNATKQ